MTVVGSGFGWDESVYSDPKIVVRAVIWLAFCIPIDREELIGILFGDLLYYFSYTSLAIFGLLQAYNN